MRFSRGVDHFYLISCPNTAFDSYVSKLCSIASKHSATLFIPVSGVASSVEDAQVAEVLRRHTKGKCTTFIQDEDTMDTLHDKQRFMDLLERLDMRKPQGQRIISVDEGVHYLRNSPSGTRPTYVLKCTGVDENRGDLTLYPLAKDDQSCQRTRLQLEKLVIPISPSSPYVFQEFIAGQGTLFLFSIWAEVTTHLEFCTHASAIDGRLTSFVACPSNDMLMHYQDATHESVGQMAREWTSMLLNRMQTDPSADGQKRRLTGHFSFDFILSTYDGQLYPIECNARVHTAVILLPLSELASCYDHPGSPPDEEVLQPIKHTITRSWIYNDIVMQYLPMLVPSRRLLEVIHPSLPACIPRDLSSLVRPSNGSVSLKVDPTLIADDWIPFLVFWHIYWPFLLFGRWWSNKPWTRVSR